MTPALECGGRVVDRVGRAVGEIAEVLHHDGGLFDGLVVRTRSGTRFVDAPDLRRVSRGVAVLGITLQEVLDPSDDRPGRGRAPAARHGRAEATESDRDAAITSLKPAFVRDEISIEGLAAQVAAAHEAETLDDLDAALADVDLARP